MNLKQLLLAVCLLTAGIAQCQVRLDDYNIHKEKVYLHTNHVYFKPGEDLFFKVYLLNAALQIPSTLSKVVYVEVINPAGVVVKKLKYEVSDGYAEGHYFFDMATTGGVYKLRAYTSWMMNEKETTWFTKEITVQKLIAPRMLMKLDFPRKGYGPGEEVLAEYSVRNLNDAPVRNYEVNYTVSLHGAVAATGSVKTDRDGKAVIRFRLPDSLRSGDGLLNVIIRYDGYAEAISRAIPVIWNEPDLQFLPEGGTFVAGIPSNMAFIAVNESGKPVDVRGEVVDSRGTIVSHFESYHQGMGVFRFTPLAGESYQARLINPVGIRQSFPLPVATDKGAVMHISRKDSLLQFRIAGRGVQSVYITGYSKGQIYYQQQVQLTSDGSMVTLNPSRFPAGIASFTLTDERHYPLAERIVFLHPHKVLHVSVKTDKKKYQPREKVTLYLHTTDELKRPVASNFSLSVVDDKLWNLADDKQDHILSWLLMSSELKGKIEEPQFYFKKEEKKALPALDLVMLTHGYRYFEYIDSVEKRQTVQYLPDITNMLSGVVVNSKGEPVSATVYLVQTGASGYLDKRFMVRQQTRANGVFFFSGISPLQSYHVIAKSRNTREQVSIKILQRGAGYNPFTAAGIMDEPEQTPLRKVPRIGKYTGPFPDTSGNRLNDVVVVGYGTVKKMEVAGSVAVVRATDIPPVTIAQLLEGRVGGIMVTPAGHPGNTPEIRIRGVGNATGGPSPLILLDDMPVEKLDVDFNPDDIDQITVLKDVVATTLYGSRGINGVILVRTKSGVKQGALKIDAGKKLTYASVAVQRVNGLYDVARRFYAPEYQSLEANERNDFRETIYWNPVVQTNKKGEATVSFYNSDAVTTFRAIAEGVGSNGEAGHGQATYSTQSSLSIDAKIPPELTEGDSLVIPLVIKNSGAKDITATITAVLPSGLEQERGDMVSVVPAGEACQTLLPVKVTRAFNGVIRFVVKSAIGTEIVTLPVAAGSKGFPVVKTLSGNISASAAFDVSEMLPGSMRAGFKVFYEMEGQLLNGIESMLSEPHGCFEQTSSSTYPNVFILKYLRAAGKINKAVEEKAMGYIQRGYERLISFETPEKGFEWFGHAPAHEALTAYGLLEFTDMQQFVDVDKKMLERTKAFLMNRRNGRGGFTIKSGGLDQFASVPDKIANIYIVYALTEAGLGKEIEPEYQAAVQAALQSNDAYQLAMMALAASNMHNDLQYRRLMEALQQTQLKSETSVVNSRDASLRVETKSLYVLALARAPRPDIGLMATTLSGILAEKSYYGYGSTQATVLALKALVTFQLLVGNRQASDLKATLNNNMIRPDMDIIPLIREGANTFTVQYTDSGQTVPYQLELAYHTLLPPNSNRAAVHIATGLTADTVKVGETVRMNVEIKNTRNELQPMAIAKLGIPAGLTVQPWQLKKMLEEKQVAYYEIFDNYLVFYWMGLSANESKKLQLDLKAEVPGRYKGKAGNVCLYYTPEYKHWSEGPEIIIQP